MLLDWRAQDTCGIDQYPLPARSEPVNGGDWVGIAGTCGMRNTSRKDSWITRIQPPVSGIRDDSFEHPKVSIPLKMIFGMIEKMKLEIYDYSILD